MNSTIKIDYNKTQQLVRQAIKDQLGITLLDNEAEAIADYIVDVYKTTKKQKDIEFYMLGEIIKLNIATITIKE